MIRQPIDQLMALYTIILPLIQVNMPERLACAHRFRMDTIIDYLGGDSIACDMLKDASDTNWIYSEKDTFTTNETGFTALPGGSRILKVNIVKLVVSVSGGFYRF